jgi:hypothetical protein
MIETAVGGVIVLLVSAVGILAYKHPAGYKLLIRNLIPLAAVAIFLVFIWTASIAAGSISALKNISESNPDARIKEVDFVINSLSNITNFWEWGFIILLLIFLYLSFLYFVLPMILEADKKHEEPVNKTKD